MTVLGVEEKALRDSVELVSNRLRHFALSGPSSRLGNNNSNRKAHCTIAAQASSGIAEHCPGFWLAVRFGASQMELLDCPK
jgi:hypothetical protein